jgi:DNA-binding NarL/FixJ family response regulator
MEALPDLPDELGVSVLNRLNLREREVLRMLVGGLSNAAIAERLSTTEQMIKNHVSHMLRKSQTYNRVGLAVFAVKHRMVIL